MKQAPRTALAMAVGYALGRSRRMKLALMAGGVLVGRRLSSGGSRADGDGGSAAGAVGGEVTHALRDRLVGAARTAAVAAASDGIDSLGNSLTERANRIRGGPDADTDIDDTDTGTADDPATDSDSGADSGPADSDDAGDSAESGGRAQRKPRAPRTPGRTAGSGSGKRGASKAGSGR
ncbi:hypothetical protein BJF85_12100 [Saccharomonospora sp. CUA-673]|uniref:hypothetical protein n=1 Tax=Saccharomonospora sp. CUA-673 TaxID=1904969 RepID=UPI00095E5A50|nr:hypothetical protein [Saccharomonospora sp. CUA-673]OLT48549.1 hypothetical protein BJF85_12100 [Saccharomonospora sp. CUA-673]